MSNASIPSSTVRLLSEAFLLTEIVNPAAADQALLSLFRRLHPELPILAVQQARGLWIRRDYRAARALLEEAELVHPAFALIKAWLALTLLSMGDGLWQSYVEDVRRLPHDTLSRQLVTIAEQAARGGSVHGEVHELESSPAFYHGLAC